LTKATRLHAQLKRVPEIVPAIKSVIVYSNPWLLRTIKYPIKIASLNSSMKLKSDEISISGELPKKYFKIADLKQPIMISKSMNQIARIK